MECSLKLDEIGADLDPLSPEREDTWECAIWREENIDISDIFALSAGHPPIFLVTRSDFLDETSQSSLSFEAGKKEESTPVDQFLGGTALSASSRLAKIERYRKKRERRCFRKQVAYECRKRVADQRLRVRGRFITKKQEEVLRSN